MIEYRWDAAPSDPIADIRRALETHEKRVKRDAIMVPFHNARLDALSRLARARAAEVDAALAIGAEITAQLLGTYANGRLRAPAEHHRTLSEVSRRIGRETILADLTEDHHGGW